MYQAVKQKYTATNMAGNRSNPMWPQVKPLPDGGQQFIIGYPLLNGCHATRTGLALFSWDFDAKGNSLGTKSHPTRAEAAASNRTARTPAQPEQPPQQTQQPQQ